MKGLSHSGQENFDACVVMGVLATLAVTIRVAVRKHLKQKLLAADWLCVLSLCLFMGHLVLMFHCMPFLSFYQVAMDTALTKVRHLLRR